MKIRLATAEDRPTLIALQLAFLHTLTKFDFEILPTEGNAERIVDAVFLPAAEQHSDPILIAFEEEEPVAALFWVCDRNGLETRHRTAHEHGAIALEGAPKNAVDLLRRVAAEVLREAGVTHVISVVPSKSKVQLKLARAAGFAPLSVIGRLDLAKVQKLEV